MSSVACGICLVSFHHVGGQMRPLFEDDESPQESLGFKLKSIGFYQDEEQNEALCQLCYLCAARVEDAYDLKQQCLKARSVCGHVNNSMQSAEVSLISDPVLRIVTELDLNVTSNYLSTNRMPGLIKLGSERICATSSVAIVSDSVRDMFTCIRKLTSTLKLNASLLSNAIHFMENTCSLLTVLLSLKGETSDAIRRSVETIRKEAEFWKLKSAMMGDSSDFLDEVSCSPLLLGRPISRPPKQQKAVDLPLDFVQPSSSLNSVPSEKSRSPLPARSANTEEIRVSPDSSSTVCSVTEPTLDVNSHSILDSEVSGDLSPADAQCVRRSFRSRSVVDHLVYWPTFKKQSSGNNKTSSSSKQKPSKKYARPSVGSGEAVLDCLLLKRECESENQSKNPEDGKWAIVRKRKAVDSHEEESASKVRLKLISSSAPSSFSQEINETENGVLLENYEERGNDVIKIKEDKDEDLKIRPKGGSPTKICPLCSKSLCSNRNLQAHIRMHTGVSPYQCSYCLKVFTSGWNRAQHERVHTGEKPYVCDLCQESFRYNVTLRQHKAKVHAEQ